MCGVVWRGTKKKRKERKKKVTKLRGRVERREVPGKKGEEEEKKRKNKTREWITTFNMRKVKNKSPSRWRRRRS
jgi:hypothetical protein